MSLIGGKRGFEFIRVDLLADATGTSEAGLRFLLGVLSGFPFAFLYLFLSKRISTSNKHLYFTITGLLINYFCFGPDCVYNLFSIFIAYCSFSINGGTVNNVLFAFVFQTTYLTIGYILNATDDYDIKWTTPQCVLCLRLIGLAWDIYDGARPEESLSADQKRICVKGNPSFMEIFGFSFCFCGFLSGPQFSFQRYLHFINERLYPEEIERLSPSRYLESLKRLVGAIIFTALYAVLDSSFRCEDLLHSSFLMKPFLVKVLHMGFVYYVQFAKYVITWWYAESICMLLGISYDGLDENGRPQWIGLRNFKFRQFISGTFFQDIIESFNINTNQWVGRYVFRRLRFLGNKNLSNFLTLMYLSVWHGFHIGYLVMFLLEFLQITAERQYRNAAAKYFDCNFSQLPLLARIPVQILGAIFKFLACGFYVQAFLLLKWKKIKVVYDSVYYWPLIVLMIWYMLLAPVMNYLNRMKKESSQNLAAKKEE